MSLFIGLRVLFVPVICNLRKVVTLEIIHQSSGYEHGFLVLMINYHSDSYKTP